MQQQDHPNHAVLEAALRLASKELRVLPVHVVIDGRCNCGKPDCTSPGKHPATPHGVKDATTNADIIRQWFSVRERRNLGLACGGLSRLVVLDIDGPEGRVWLRALTGEDIDTTSTVVVRTGQKTTQGETWTGRHVWFSWPDDMPLPKNGVKIVSGVDIRSEGGYVLAPPSLHSSGVHYQYMGDGEDADVAVMPQVLVEAIVALQGKQKRELRAKSPTGSHARIPEGGRNDRLYCIGCGMRRRGCEEHDISTELRRINANQCDPPLDDCEVDKVVASCVKQKKGDTLLMRLIGGERPNTDLYLAEQFAMDWQGLVLWCPDHQSWYAYCDERGIWLKDVGGQATRWLRETVRRVLDQTYDDSQQGDKDHVKLRNVLSKFRDHRKEEDVLKSARSLPGMTVEANFLDARPWLLACENLTIDLKSGESRANAPSDLLTRATGTPYDPLATSETWERFLSETFPDPDTLAYVQRALGSAIDGRVADHLLHLAVGTGMNGKSTLFKAIRRALGDYAWTAPGKLLAKSRGERHPADLASLRGRRLVIASEWDEGDEINVSLMKQLTGNDSITARGMKENFSEIQNQWHFWIPSNHLPRLREAGLAVARRMRVIPFDHVVTERDERLDEKLATAAPAILRWLVDGHAQCQKVGLDVKSAAITQATFDYVRGQDCMAEAFAAMFTVVGPNDLRVKPFPLPWLSALIAKFLEAEGMRRDELPTSRQVAAWLRNRKLVIKRGAQGKSLVLGIRLEECTVARFAMPNLFKEIEAYLQKGDIGPPTDGEQADSTLA